MVCQTRVRNPWGRTSAVNRTIGSATVLAEAALTKLWLWKRGAAVHAIVPERLACPAVGALHKDAVRRRRGRVSRLRGGGPLYPRCSV